MWLQRVFYIQDSLTSHRNIEILWHARGDCHVLQWSVDCCQNHTIRWAKNVRIYKITHTTNIHSQNLYNVILIMLSTIMVTISMFCISLEQIEYMIETIISM